MVGVVSAVTGRTPLVTGKPDPAMHAECVRRTGARRPLVVGDRLDTDIEGARRAGAASLLVLTGVTDPATLLAAGPEHRPDLLSADAAGLLTPHPAVRRRRQRLAVRPLGGAGRPRAATSSSSRRPRTTGTTAETVSTGCGRCAWRTGPGIPADGAARPRRRRRRPGGRGRSTRWGLAEGDGPESTD